MKHFKKFFSYLVALTMVLSLAAFTGVKVHAENAAEATTYTLTLKGTAKDHTYEAYQVFKGDLSGDTLSNIQWGTGIDSTKKDKLISALKGDNTLKDKFGSVTDAASVAEALEGVASNSAEMDAFAQVVGQYLSTTSTSKSSTVNDNKTEITGLAAGYYLVKDKDGSLDGKSDAYTKFIVQVVGNAESDIKSGVPTVEKKVKDTNDSTGETSNWQDSADADFNDNVKYKITGTMPSNIGSYTSYQYIFTDTMSKGLTYKASDSDNNVKNYEIYFYANKDDAAKDAKVKGVNITDSFKDNGEGESVTNSSDAKYNGGKKFTWTCSDLKSINSLKDEKGNSKLTENSAIVVYYEAKLNEGAAIGAAGNPNKVDLTYSNNPNKGGEGETGKTPEDKNIVFTYKLDVNKYKDNKNDVNNKTDEAEFKLYKEIKGTNDKPDSVNEVTLTKANKVYSAVRLDDGVYILQETKAPDGYNKMDGSVKFGSTTYENAKEFTISAKHDTTSDDPKLTELTGGNVKSGEATFTFTPDTSAGLLTADVVDKKGSILPSTGGMGTTLLYVAGGILVACAAAYVVMSRKHSTNK
ncbi:cell surface protein [Intestinibaculum porci]|uniref:Cell surface protein n=1 Tax=Intestinibaculum porci TaxID=2487118 RepID=A0A3G9JR68_9FIRM|nr:isopeptide-forming domain-containing fimbrial protein [Intestinibaculum porci]BBH25539.1 cell surface protein [Intestinibaculum porci]